MVIYKLRDWIDINKLDWQQLSSNPNAIDLLEKNQDKIYWFMLLQNPNAIHLLEKNKNKINWNYLSLNPNAIDLLEKNQDKINWDFLSENPSIFEYDYEAMKSHFYGEHCYGKELIETLFHPRNFHKFSKDNWNIGE